MMAVGGFGLLAPGVMIGGEQQSLSAYGKLSVFVDHLPNRLPGAIVRAINGQD